MDRPSGSTMASHLRNPSRRGSNKDPQNPLSRSKARPARLPCTKTGAATAPRRRRARRNDANVSRQDDVAAVVIALTSAATGKGSPFVSRSSPPLLRLTSQQPQRDFRFPLQKSQRKKRKRPETPPPSLSKRFSTMMKRISRSRLSLVAKISQEDGKIWSRRSDTSEISPVPSSRR